MIEFAGSMDDTFLKVAGIHLRPTNRKQGNHARGTLAVHTAVWKMGLWFGEARGDVVCFCRVTRM